MRPELRTAPEGQGLIQVAWVLQGCRAKWSTTDWLRYVDAKLPADVMGRAVGASGRALMFEQAKAEEYRARLAFGLKN